MAIKIFVNPFDDEDISHGVHNYTQSRQTIITYVTGHRTIGLQQDIIEYASYLESRMAVLLIRAGIPFIPHREVALYDSCSDHVCIHCPDFVLYSPIHVNGSLEEAQVIEVKGVLRPDTYVKKQLFESTWSLPYLIVGRLQLNFWEAYGLLS